MSKLFDSIRKDFSIGPGDLIFPSTLGPITIDTLTLLEGARWRGDPIGYPGEERQLLRGGPPVVLANWTDEKGWALTIFAFFRSPYAVLNLQVDDWNVNASPFLLQSLGFINPLNVTFFNTIYNPATPFGPLYGLILEGGYALPYSRRVSVTLSLPAAAPIAQTNVFFAFAGKIWIQDESTFLRSIKRHLLEQMTGQKIERYP